MHISVKEREPKGKMNTKIGQFQATNPNPVLSVAKDGAVLDSNAAGEPLLHGWSVGVGEKLPSSIGYFVQRVISRNSPEKMEVKMGKRVYLVTFHPLPEEERVTIYGFDISDQKKLEEKLRIKEKQNDVLYKVGKIALEYESLQTFMDESVKLIAGILELKYCKIMELMPDGNFLLRAGIGWKPEFVGKQVVGGGKKSQAGYTLFSRMPVIVEDFEEENRFEKPKILKIHGMASGASVVIGSMEKIFGVLVVNSTKKRKFTSDDTYFLNSVAFLIAQVVERKKAEEALRESEGRFRALAENSPDLITRFDKQNRHMYANPAAAEYYGRSPEEIISKTQSELGIDPEMAKFSEKQREKVLTTGKPETMEFQYISPKGKEYYFNTRIVPEFVNGRVTSVLAISRDIKDIKKAEVKLKETLDNLEEMVEERTTQLDTAYNSLKESEERLAEAQKMAHIGNWVWDIATGKEYWSDELHRIFKLDPQEAAPSYNEYLNYVHPDDRDYVDNAFKGTINGKPYEIDHRIILANGEERTVHIQAEVVFNDKNIPIQTKGIVQDITERKKAEEKIQNLANIVESSNDAIGTMSLDGIITSWNKGAEQVYGYSAEEILGKTASILATSYLDEEIKKLTEMVKQGGKDPPI